MPTDSVYTSARILRGDLRGYEFKRHTVKILSRVNFNQAEVPAHQTGIGTCDSFHIRSSIDVTPCVAVGGVIVMAEVEVTGPAHGIEPFNQGLRRS